MSQIFLNLFSRARDTQRDRKKQSISSGDSILPSSKHLDKTKPYSKASKVRDDHRLAPTRSSLKSSTLDDSLSQAQIPSKKRKLASIKIDEGDEATSPLACLPHATSEDEKKSNISVNVPKRDSIDHDSETSDDSCISGSDNSEVIEFDDDGPVVDEGLLREGLIKILGKAPKGVIERGPGFDLSGSDIDDELDDDLSSSSDGSDLMPTPKSRSVFVSNLPLTCTRNQLLEYFNRQVGHTTGSRIFVRSQHQTTSFGFVDFKSNAFALKAIEKCNGIIMSDHLISVQLSDKNKNKEGEVENPGVHVRNLPFGIDEQKLREIFSPCGEILHVRIPNFNSKKNFRGLAFIDFRDKQALLKAKKLNRVVIDGRQILIEITKNITLKKGKPEVNREANDHDEEESSDDEVESEENKAVGFQTNQPPKKEKDRSYHSHKGQKRDSKVHGKDRKFHKNSKFKR